MKKIERKIEQKYEQIFEIRFYVLIIAKKRDRKQDISKKKFKFFYFSSNVQ